MRDKKRKQKFYFQISSIISNKLKNICGLKKVLIDLFFHFLVQYQAFTLLNFESSIVQTYFLVNNLPCLNVKKKSTSEAETKEAKLFE